MAFGYESGDISASWQPPAYPTRDCWWVSPQVAPHPGAKQLAPRRLAMQQLASLQQVALQGLLRLERLELVHVVVQVLVAAHVVVSVQQHWQAQPPATSGRRPHTPLHGQHMGSVPPPARVHGIPRMEPRLPTAPGHHHLRPDALDPHRSERGRPNTVRESNGRTEASIWHRDA